MEEMAGTTVVSCTNPSSDNQVHAGANAGDYVLRTESEVRIMAKVTNKRS